MNQQGLPSLHDLPIAVVIYDPSGRVTEANPAACALLGLSRDQLVGSSAEDAGWLVLEGKAGLITDRTHPVLAVLRSRQPELGVLARAKRVDGTNVWILVDAVPYPSDSREVSHVVTTVTDVTHILTTSRLTDRTGGDHILAAVTDQLAGARLEPAAILTAVTEALSRLRPGTWVASLINKDPSTVRLFAANDSDPFIARYIEEMHVSGGTPATSVATHVIETGQPVLIPNASYDEFLKLLTPEVRDYIAENQPPVPEPVRYIGVLVVPMRARGATVGTIGLFERRSSNPLTEKDTIWLQMVADRVGVAIENAQLYQDAISRLERLASLRSVGLAITASPDLRLTLQVILDQVTDKLGVDSADVLLLDESDGMLAAAASAGFRSTDLPNFRLPVDEGLPGRAATRQRIETVTALGAFSQFRRRTLFAREGFKAYGAVPLIARGKLLGVLEVFHRSPLQPDQEWIGFLDALASDAAIAIDNAAMHDRLQKSGLAGTPRKAGSPAPQLSRVERDILAHIVRGETNREIAETIHLSEHTVKFHVHQMLQKADVANRTELAHKTTQEGWIQSNG